MEPIENTEFSGRLLVRLSKSLHSKASYVAKREGVSLNQFIVSCIAEQVVVRRVEASHVQTLLLETTGRSQGLALTIMTVLWRRSKGRSESGLPTGTRPCRIRRQESLGDGNP